MTSMLIIVSTLVLVLTTSAIHLPHNPQELNEWLCGPQNTKCNPSEFSNIPTFRKALLSKLHDVASEALATPEGMRNAFAAFFDHHHFKNPEFQRLMDSVIAKHDTLAASTKKAQRNNNNNVKFTPAGNNPYPYFAFIPTPVIAVVPNGQSVQFSSPCFRNNVASASLSPDDQTLTVLFQISNASSSLCSDNYLLGSMQGVSIQSFFLSGEHVVTFNLTGASQSLMYDVKTKGIRVFHFNDDIIQLLYDVLDTVVLFLGPMSHSSVDPTAAANNLYFLDKYAQIPPTMVPRNATVVNLPTDYIQSGDFLGVIRLDGTDPMLAWAMGSTTGHTTVAMRAPNGTLFICESTISDSYWPVNGVQCTEYNLWVQQAVNADYNVVHAPLNPTLRAQFNATAAWEFFETVKGLDYGYHNLLFGWIDTLSQNYPCLPPNYEQCLTWDFVEVLFGFLDTIAPSVGDILFNQALNLRLGTRGLLFADMMMYADQHNIPRQSVPTLLEQDSFVYNTTRNGVPAQGKSQVCCVFVCNMWKAGGIFGNLTNQFNCGEMTNYDDYSLNLFDSAKMGSNRPVQCQVQDPNNQLCQIVGKYTLNLNNLNARQPYPHMSESCPSLAPNYTRPANC